MVSSSMGYFDFKNRLETVNDSGDFRMLVRIPEDVAKSKSLVKEHVYVQVMDKSGSLVTEGESSIYYDKANGYRIYIFKSIREEITRRYGHSSDCLFGFRLIAENKWLIQEL